MHIIGIISYILTIRWAIIAKKLELSFSPNSTAFVMYSSANVSIFSFSTTFQYVVFGNKSGQTMAAVFGDLTSVLPLQNSSTLRAQVSVDRRIILNHTIGENIELNTLCEFFYSIDDVIYIDDKFCCRIELTTRSKSVSLLGTASCQLQLNSNVKRSGCYIPIRVASNAIQWPSTAFLSASVHRQRNNIKCSYAVSSGDLYAVSWSFPILFSTRNAVLWRPTFNREGDTLLIGEPLQSVRTGNELLIPVRLVVERGSAADSQTIALQCVIDKILRLHSMFVDSQRVSVDEHFQLDNETHYIRNLQLTTTVGHDRELFSFNVSVAYNGRNNHVVKIQCCISEINKIKSVDIVCGGELYAEIAIQTNSFILIPSLKDDRNFFSIYSIQSIEFPTKSLTAYNVVNYRDRIISDVSNRVEVKPLDHDYITIEGSDTYGSSKMATEFQDIVSPWAISMQMMGIKHILIAPLRVWRTDSCRIVLSTDSVRRIRNWLIPRSSTDTNANCIPRFRVVRLKILCRLSSFDETGIKRYVGLKEKSATSNGPFIDMTEYTELNQFIIQPQRSINIDKSINKDHFVISASTQDESSEIKLYSIDMKTQLTSTPILAEVESNPISITDIDIRCVDTLTLTRQNDTTDDLSIYDVVTVNLSYSQSNQPCYMLVFLQYSDGSIERLSIIDQYQYRLLLTGKDNRGQILGQLIKDGDRVVVKAQRNVNISLFESSNCHQPRLIFTKPVNWTALYSDNQFVESQTGVETLNILTSNNSLTHPKRPEESQGKSINLIHVSIYAIFGILGTCLLIYVIVHKACIYHNHQSHSNGITGSIDRPAYTIDGDCKFINRASTRNFSSISKLTTNCMKPVSNKTFNNDPYPPLLPPPGPISPSYDLAVPDAICSDSAVDSGVELGKLSNYSSNTCPSNDNCCISDPYRTLSATEGSLPRPGSHFNTSFIGLYPYKDTFDSAYLPNDSVMLSSLNSFKAISNLRQQPQW